VKLEHGAGVEHGLVERATVVLLAETW